MKTDVTIIGGGLAGLTLALQLKKAQAAISILVLEQRKSTAPASAHKVGESTVELGTYYLREVLGLGKYLDEQHLPKQGLRFFFSPEVHEVIEDRVELGARSNLPIPSHQIDRGRFENDLMEQLLEKGIATRRGIMNSHRESAYSHVDASLPISEGLADNSIILPLYIPMEEEDKDYVISALRSCLGY